MDKVMEFLRDFNVWTVAIRLTLALFIGGFIGIERGRQRRAAGLRTHILVAVGSCLTVLVGFYAADVLGLTTDPMRVSAQVISGIGFLGVGTILVKGRFQITGLTTAAGLWVTASMGIALGAGFYEGALIAFLLSAVTVMLLPGFERRMNNRHSSFGVYIEVKGDSPISSCIDELKREFSAHDIQVTLPRSGVPGNVGIEASVSSTKKNRHKITTVKEYFRAKSYVVFVIESM